MMKVYNENIYCYWGLDVMDFIVEVQFKMWLVLGIRFVVNFTITTENLFFIIKDYSITHTRFRQLEIC